jgi:GTPase Era involved in 16S rRNA processing
MRQNVQQYLDLFSSIIENFIESKTKKKLKNKLNLIQEKVDNPVLNLAVVGEFSSGKSTFINAFLRRKLLKAACKATTASATYIESGSSELKVEVSFLNKIIDATEHDFQLLKDEVEQFTAQKIETIFDALDCLTSEQHVADNVKEIRLHVDGKGIPSNIKIIDTPGINPGDELAKNHIKVTQHIVEHIADMAIVLIPAHAVMSATLESFLEKHSKRFLHRCIFVITSMDNAPEETRLEIEKLVEDRLRNNLGIENPTMFSESAITMLPVLKIPESKKAEWTYWQDKFIAFEKDVWEQLQPQRDIVVEEHLYHLLHDLISSLQKEMESSRADLQSTKSILEKGRISKIEKLTHQILENANSEISNEIDSIANHIQNRLAHYLNKSFDATNQIIEGGDFLLSFEENEKPQITDAVQFQARKYCEDVDKRFKRIDTTIGRITKNFNNEFNKHYSMFPFLSREINIRSIHTQKLSMPTVSFASSVDYIQREKEKENSQAIGAAAICGGIGFFLGGPIGLAVGAAIGGVGGKVAGYSAEEIQSGVKTRTQSDINKCLRNVQNGLKRNVRNRGKQVLKEIDKLCENHINEYGAQVEGIIADQKKKERQLLSQIGSLTDEIKKLQVIEDEIQIKRMELRSR